MWCLRCRDRVKPDDNFPESKRTLKNGTVMLSGLGQCGQKINVIAKSLAGEGLIDDVKTIAENAKVGIRQNYPPKVRAFIESHANWTITHIRAARKPIEKSHEMILNALTLGKLAENKKKLSYDQLYHLSLEIALKDKDVEHELIRLEKNHVIQIFKLKLSGGSIIDEISKRIDKASETDESQIESRMDINLRGKVIKFGEFMEKGYKAAGDSFFLYDAIENNCQKFVYVLLKANGLLTQDVSKYIYQPAKTLLEKSEWVKEVAKYITDASARIDSLINGK